MENSPGATRSRKPGLRESLIRSNPPNAWGRGFAKCPRCVPPCAGVQPFSAISAKKVRAYYICGGDPAHRRAPGIQREPLSWGFFTAPPRRAARGAIFGAEM